MPRYLPPARWFYILAIIVIFMAVVLRVQPALAATITVNSDADNATAGNGLCTLREAINNANTTVDTTGGDCGVGTAGVDTISFNIGGPSALRIALSSPLPTITAPMIIDGTTQPGYAGFPSIQLVGSSAGASNVSGFHITGGGTTIRGLVISSFSGNGIWLDSSNNAVEGCYIGTDRSSSIALGNTNYGVLISSATAATNNFVGTTNTSLRNVISGNGYGVGIVGSTATNNTVQDSFIGTNITGGFQVGNLNSGVLISDSAGNTIGSPGMGANLISSNREYGVLITGLGASNNTVAGNFIGTDNNGMISFQNVKGGVMINNAPNNTVGPSNVISGNYTNLTLLGPGSQNNVVKGNYIGVNGAGTAAVDNVLGEGVRIDNASNNLIGGGPGDSNVISGNWLQVILYEGSTGNRISGNFIGTDKTGLNPVTGGYYGVTIRGSTANNIVGVSSNGSGLGNIIAFNNLSGIILGYTGTGHRISRNHIFSNGQLGIDINADGVTPNDLGDADTGPNNLQNFPFITLATEAPIIQGALNSTPNTTFTIEFFTQATCDSTGYGEGQYYAGSTNVTTDGTGNTSFSFTPLPGYLVAGQYVTATAIDPAGNTSEFSACQLVFSATTLTPGFTSTYTSTPTKTSTPTPTNTGTITSTFTFTPTNTPTNTLTSTPTNTPSNTPTNTPTSTPTNTLTNTPTYTLTSTPTNTLTPTKTLTPSATNTGTLTNTPTFTATLTPSNTLTNTPSNTPTNTPTSTLTDTPTNTATGTLSVTPTFTATSTATNTATSTVTSTATTTATATQTLASGLLISSAFIPSAVNVGGVTTLTFVITNSNPFPLTGLTFLDNLSGGLVIAQASNVSSTCGGNIIGGTAGNTQIGITNGTLLANGSCQVRVDVISTTGGQITNTTGPVSSTQTGPRGTATTSLIVNAPTAVPTATLAPTQVAQTATAAAATATAGATAAAAAQPAASFVPLCGDLNGSTDLSIRANVPPGTARDANGVIASVYCGVLTDPTQHGVLNRQVIRAIEVFALTPGAAASVVRFIQPVRICLLGYGTMLYRDATGQPRVVTELQSFGQSGYTCVDIPNAGTVILVVGQPTFFLGGDLPGVSSGGSGAIAATGACQIVTRGIVNLRGAASVTSEILARVPFRATLNVLDFYNGWYLVDYLGNRGWLSGRFVRRIGNC